MSHCKRKTLQPPKNIYIYYPANHKNYLTQNKQVDADGNYDSLSSMGFSVLHSFEEVTCDASTWNMMAAS